MNIPCTVCDGPTRQIKNGYLLYYACHACGFIFRNPSSHLSAKEEKARYLQHNNTPDDIRYVNYFRAFIKAAVQPYLGTGRIGLDFGCGMLPLLARVLKNEHGFAMDVYDLYFFPDKVYIGRSYDLIVSTEVLEHIRDPLGCFRLFKDHIKDNGMISIMTHFHPDDDEKFGHWYYQRDLTHISFYTPKTIQTMAQKTCMSVVYCDEKKMITLRSDT